MATDITTINSLIAARDIAIQRKDTAAIDVLNNAIRTMISTGNANSSGPLVNSPDLNTDGAGIADQPVQVTIMGALKSKGQESTTPISTVIDTQTSSTDTGVSQNATPTLQVPIVLTQKPECEYRYSFGCPVFSKYATDAGCRILVPVYRTCYTNTISNSQMPATELIGNIDITVYGDDLYQVQESYINEAGISGKRTISGRRLTAQGLFQAISEFATIKTTQNFLLYSDGIYRNVNTPIQLDVITNNLLNINDTTNIGIPSKGTIQDWSQYLSNTCNLSSQPRYCLTYENFVPSKTNENNNTGGKFCDSTTGKVAIPNSRQLVSTNTNLLPANGSEQYVAIPNKPCAIGIERSSQTIRIYSEQYGYPCYSNSDYTGNIIGYDSIETRETTEQGEITKIYVSERQDPNCSYQEIETEYEEDDQANPCLGIIKKDVTRKYADGRQEVYSKGQFVRYFRKMDADCSPETIKVYHPLDMGKDIISGKVKAKTTGLFDLSQSLECYNTSSTQTTATKKYYYEITDCDTCGKTPYFAVAYGNRLGSGSLYADGEVYDTATKTIYSQYRLLALESDETQFSFYTNGVATASNDIYVINFYRNGLSDRLDPGNFEINLHELTGNAYANNVFTGSNVGVSGSNTHLRLIDNSSDESETSTCTHDPYISYDIVSGSLTNGIYTTANRHTYGTVYPNLGVIILDPSKLNSLLAFNTVTGSNIAGDNAMKLFKSISGSGNIGQYLKARNVKYKTTNHYFVRVSAPLANFSNNPTYTSGSDGYLFHPCYEGNPQTYITTVGLYNDFNELLAVAKLSQPVNKSFDNDVLLKIRLNW